MTSLRAIADTDLIEVERGGVSYKATGAQLQDQLVQPYAVPYSARFTGNSGKAYLWQNTSGGNRKVTTISFWIKLHEAKGTGISDYGPGVLAIGDNNVGGNFGEIILDSANKLGVLMGSGGALYTRSATTKPVLNSWEHWCFQINTGVGGADSCKFYRNGTKIGTGALKNSFGDLSGTGAKSMNTAFNQAMSGTFNTYNQNAAVGNGNKAIQKGYVIGQGRLDASGYGFGWVDYINATFADFHLIDGQALAPTAFAHNVGGWKAKRYEGTYGTNGFHLTFEVSGNPGKDFSGRNNNFTKVGTINRSTGGPPAA